MDKSPNQVIQRFAHWTECQLATLEELKGYKTTSLTRIKQQKDICHKMILDFVQLFPDWEEVVFKNPHTPLPRLKAIVFQPGLDHALIVAGIKEPPC